MPKAIVLLSGGLDSCVACAIAAQAHEVHCLNVYYGQRHFKERQSSLAVAQYYHAPLTVVDVFGLHSHLQKASALMKADAPLLDRKLEEMSNGKAPTYVPGRNTIMLSLAQSLAEAEGADAVFIGVNHLDYSGYVDCRPAFITAWNEFAQYATFRAVEGQPIWVEAPLLEMSKVQIIKKGIELHAPLWLTWSCYAGEAKPCGTCDSCKIRQAAFKELGVEDAWEAYEVQHRSD